MLEQTVLFYEDINDAISKTINGNPKGLSLKQIAADLWPARNPDTARSVLSRAISPECHDVRLSPEEVTKVMEITGRPEDVIYYLCDKHGFERPAKRDKSSFEREIKGEIKSLMDTLKHVGRKVEQLERLK